MFMFLLHGQNWNMPLVCPKLLVSWYWNVLIIIRIHLIKRKGLITWIIFTAGQFRIPKEEREGGFWSIIANDVMVDILCRLTPVDVIGFKCGCKMCAYILMEGLHMRDSLLHCCHAPWANRWRDIFINTCLVRIQGQYVRPFLSWA